MSFRKLIFKPGINRDQTNYANEGGWRESDKIRFLSGFPQKIGGWVRYTVTAFAGVARTMYNWTIISSGATYNFLAIGTNAKIYTEFGANISDISPYKQIFTTATSPSTNNSLSTTNTSATLTIKGIYNSITTGLAVGDYVVISGAVALGGITAPSINKEFVVTAVNTGTNTFTVLTDTTATSSVANGGGTAIIINIQLSMASAPLVGVGWGVPQWGGAQSPNTGWGIGAQTTTAGTSLKLVFFDKYYYDLVFNVRFGNIYYWTSVVSSGTRAITLQAKAIALAQTYANIPQQVTQILFDDESNILIALGCEPYGSEGVTRDPLLFRWASQDNLFNWDPTTVTSFSTTAGELRVQSGSAIMRGISLYKEIAVFTESSLTSFQYVGSINEIYAKTLISDSVSLIGPSAVIASGGTAYWMGVDKFYKYDGRITVLNCTLRSHIFDNLNYNLADNVIAGLVNEYNEIWWFYASLTAAEVDLYVVYNYEEDIWYYGTTSGGLTRTAWLDSPLRTHPQAANFDDGYIYDQEKGADYEINGVCTAFDSYIQSSDVTIEETGDSFMLVRKIIPDVSFENSSLGSIPVVDFTIYPKNFSGSAYRTTNAENQTLGDSVTGVVSQVDLFTEQVFPRSRGRQMAIKISSSTTLGVAWQLGVPRVDARKDGRRG